MEPFQTAAQRKVLAELGVLALQVLDALLGLRDGLDRRGIALGDLVGQPLDLALERGDLVAVRLDLRLEQAAGGIGVLGRGTVGRQQRRGERRRGRGREQLSAAAVGRVGNRGQIELLEAPRRGRFGHAAGLGDLGYGGQSRGIGLFGRVTV